MVLTKQELLGLLKNELRLILHLASKVDPANQDFRPTPKQRSTIELLRYLTSMGPIHLRGVLANSWDMDTWRQAWQVSQARAQDLTLNDIQTELGGQGELFTELLEPLSDVDLRAPVELFGMKGTRGATLVTLVLCHYSAYRMQLFQYLKASGRDELNTLNLWVGVDGQM